jgi:hypothetical protein
MHEASKDKKDEKSSETREPVNPVDSGVYQQEMDEMRCILYSHGGM